MSGRIEQMEVPEWDGSNMVTCRACGRSMRSDESTLTYRRNGLNCLAKVPCVQKGGRPMVTR